MQQPPTRREASKLILAAIGSTVLPFLKGCGSNPGRSGSSNGNLQNTEAFRNYGNFSINDEFTPSPEQYNSDSTFQDLISDFKSSMRDVDPEGELSSLPVLATGKDILNLEGKFKITNGAQLSPSIGQLSPGDFSFYDQRYDEAIDETRIKTSFEQLLGNAGPQSGTSDIGEIVRAEKIYLFGQTIDAFTVYAAFKVNSKPAWGGTCQEDALAIFDGIIDRNPDRPGLAISYFTNPIKNYTPEICELFPTAGLMILEGSNLIRGKTKSHSMKHFSLINSRLKEIADNNIEIIFGRK